MSGVNCFTAFNGWRSERLAIKCNQNRDIIAFQIDQGYLQTLFENQDRLTDEERKIVIKAQYPREFFLKPKDLKGIETCGGHMAIEKLFKITGAEEELIYRHFNIRTGELKPLNADAGNDNGATSAPPVRYKVTPFTHG